MKTLLVWQSVPESVDWYVLDGLGEADLAVLHTAHGSFINAVDVPEAVEEALDKISARLTEIRAGARYDCDWLNKHNADIGMWCAAKVEESALPTIGPIDKVFTCGFLM